VHGSKCNLIFQPSLVDNQWLGLSVINEGRWEEIGAVVWLWMLIAAWINVAVLS